MGQNSLTVPTVIGTRKRENKVRAFQNKVTVIRSIFIPSLSGIFTGQNTGIELIYF